jgi:hypothetical protein
MKELILAAILAGNIYPISGKVVTVDALEDTVTFQTESGMLYAFSGTEDWMIGDNVAAIMWDNDTPEDVTDDAIMTVRYTDYNE